MLFSDRITVWRVSRNTRPEDRGYPAGAEFALDGVTVGEGGFQAVKLVRHD